MPSHHSGCGGTRTDDTCDRRRTAVVSRAPNAVPGVGGNWPVSTTAKSRTQTYDFELILGREALRVNNRIYVM